MAVTLERGNHEPHGVGTWITVHSVSYELTVHPRKCREDQIIQQIALENLLRTDLNILLPSPIVTPEIDWSERK